MNEWVKTYLGEITELVTKGTTPSEKDGGFSDVGINYIKSDAVSYDGRIDRSKFVYISKDVHEKFKRSQLKTDDILFSMAGAFLGKTGMVEEDMLPANTNQALAIIRLNKFKAHPRFVNYFFRQNTVIDFINNMSGQSAQPNINFQEIKSIEIDLPPFEEQNSIVAVLSTLDDKIDLLHRQNKTLEAMAETFFRQRFVKEAGENWGLGKLGDEFDFTMGQSPLGSSFNEDGVGVPMFQGNADFEFRFPKERVYTTAPTRFAQRFDTLISVRAPVGAQNMAHKECCIGRGVAAFRYKKDKNYYTYTYFKLRSLMEEIKKFNDEGTVFGSISKSDFDALESTIPPFELIVAYEKDAKPINDKVIANCAQIRTLEKLRNTLLPKLMSGEVRVVV